MIYQIYRYLPSKFKFKIKNILNSFDYSAKHLRKFRKDKIIKNKKLTDLIVYTNNFCNAHCGFCDVTRVDQEAKSALGIARPLLGTPVYMRTQVFEKIMNDQFLINKKLLVIFLMTEPLLSKNIGELCKIAKEKDHITKITTNGFLLQKRANDICKNLDHLQISIDGPKEMHDEIRGKNFYENAIKGARLIKELNPKIKISINTTITNINYKILSSFAKELDQLEIDIDELRFQFIDFVSEEMSKKQQEIVPEIPQSISTIDEEDYLALDKDMLFNEIVNLKNIKLRNIKKLKFKPNIDDRIVLDKYFDKKGETILSNNVCSTPYTQMAVNTSGDVYWHMRCFNDYKLGNINLNTFQEIWNGEKATLFRKKFEENNLCFPACTRCCGIMSTQEIFKF